MKNCNTVFQFFVNELIDFIFIHIHAKFVFSNLGVKTPPVITR